MRLINPQNEMIATIQLSRNQLQDQMLQNMLRCLESKYYSVRIESKDRLENSCLDLIRHLTIIPIPKTFLNMNQAV